MTDQELRSRAYAEVLKAMPEELRSLFRGEPETSAFRHTLLELCITAYRLGYRAAEQDQRAS